MTIARNVKEVYLEEIIDNLMGDERELSPDAVPRTREEVLLSQIEILLRNRTGGSGSGNGGNSGNSYTKDEIDQLIGDINTLLDDVNGDLLDEHINLINIINGEVI